jgi:putative heme iron utilization protein
MEQTPSSQHLKANDSHRKAVRRLMRLGRSGALATQCADGNGGSWPLASLVTYATDTDGSPLFLLSTLADHTQALLNDPRCSLMIEQASHLDTPQTGERVSLCGIMENLPDATTDASARNRFLAQNPAARRYVDFADFALWRLKVERAHYVGGFARATWISDGILADPTLTCDLAAIEPNIIEHMNSDHADALADYATVFLRFNGQDNKQWKMVSLDCDGFHLGYADCARTYYLPFENPLTAASQCRSMLVTMAEKARSLAAQMAFERS